MESDALAIPFLTVTEADISTATDVEATASFCVYSNTYSAPGIPYPEFQFGAISDNGTPVGNSGHFISKNGNHQIEYYVSYAFNGSGFTSLTEGTPSSNISMGSVPNSTCGNGLGNNATIKIRLIGTTLPSTPEGNYADVLTIDILPPI